MYRNCRDPWQLADAAKRNFEYRLLGALAAHHLQGRSPSRRRIVEIGSGQGHCTRVLARSGRVIGIEVSAAAIAQARRRVPAAQFRQWDIRDGVPPLRGQADLLVCYRVLWYVVDVLPAALRNMRALLRPDGTGLFELNYYRGRYYGSNIIRGEKDFLTHLNRSFTVREVFQHRGSSSDPDYTLAIVSPR